MIRYERRPARLSNTSEFDNKVEIIPILVYNYRNITDGRGDCRKMYCSKCGAQINDGVQFCPNCGSRQGAAEQQQPTYQQPVSQEPAYQQPVYPQPIYQQPTYQQPGYTAPQQRAKSVAALVLGIIGLVAWIIPLVGYPVTIVGLVLSVNGMMHKKAYATGALVLSIIGLLLCIINSVAGAVMGYNGYFN